MSIAVAEKTVSSSNFGMVLAGEGDHKPPRAGAGRVRLPNKTQWSLRDIVTAARRERALMREILAWIKREKLRAKGRFDNEGLVQLGELSDLVAERTLEIGDIESMAADARLGIYEPPPLAASASDAGRGKKGRKATES